MYENLSSSFSLPSSHSSNLIHLTGVCDRCKQGMTLFDDLRNATNQFYQNTCNLHPDRTVQVSEIQNHLHDHIRSSENHLLFEVKHMMRDANLDHPFNLELNTLASEKQVQSYFEFERELARRFILTQEYDDFSDFFLKLTLIIKTVRLKFLAGHPSPHTQHQLEPFTPSFGIWCQLFDFTTDQYGMNLEAN